MDDEYKFLIVYVLVLIFVRLYCLVTPDRSILFNDGWHHIYAGALLLGLLVFFRVRELHPSKNKAILLYAISLALIFDELLFIFTPFINKTKSNYFSGYSLLGTVLFSAAIVVKRKAILKRIIKNN